MPQFSAFRALRYSADLLPQVSAPPYDVLSGEDRQRLASQSPYNIVHVDVPAETDGENRYVRAARTLDSWRGAGILELDPKPSLTVYRMRFHDDSGRSRSTIGVIGALEVVDEGAGGVLPHERTTPKAKTDRLDLTRATSCNLSAVWGLSLAEGLTGLLERGGRPMGSVLSEGVEHSFERIDDEDHIGEICARISSRDVLIADGHHRYAISRTFRDELRTTDSPLAKAGELTMTYVAELVEEQLSVAAIHRVYRIPDWEDFEQSLRSHFTFDSCPEISTDITPWMQSHGSLVLLAPHGRTHALTPRQERFTDVRDLDGSRLEHALSRCAHEVDYQHGVGNVRAMVESGTVDAAILIRPVTIDEIRRTAREHALMPPKSTFFTPKLLTGAAIRPLEV